MKKFIKKFPEFEIHSLGEMAGLKEVYAALYENAGAKLDLCATSQLARVAMKLTSIDRRPGHDNVSELAEALRVLKKIAKESDADASCFSLAFAATNAMSAEQVGHPMFYTTEPPKNLGGVMVCATFPRGTMQSFSYENILNALSMFYWAEGIFYPVDTKTMTGTDNKVWLWFQEKFTVKHAEHLADNWVWTVVSDEPAKRHAGKRAAEASPETPAQIIDRLTRRRITIEAYSTDAAVAECTAIDAQIAALLK